MSRHLKELIFSIKKIAEQSNCSAIIKFRDYKRLANAMMMALIPKKAK